MSSVSVYILPPEWREPPGQDLTSPHVRATRVPGEQFPHALAGVCPQAKTGA